jgi:hypothetical protein
MGCNSAHVDIGDWRQSLPLNDKAQWRGGSGKTSHFNRQQAWLGASLWSGAATSTAADVRPSLTSIRLPTRPVLLSRPGLLLPVDG